MENNRLASPQLIDRDDSILLIIDLQDGFLKRVSAERRAMVVDHCRFLVELAGRLAIPVFVTVEDSPRNGHTAEPVRARVDGVIPDRDKRVFGLCGQDDLRQAILAQPKRTAVLIGMDTDVCVLHSAVGLVGEGFRAVIVSNATEAPGTAKEEGLARARLLGVETISTRGLYHEWIRTVALLYATMGEPSIALPAGMIL